MVGQTHKVLSSNADYLVVAKHFHEDLDSVFGWHVVADDGPQASEGAVSNLDFVPRLHAGLEGLDFIFADFLAEEGDEVGIDCGPLFTKMNHACDAPSMDHYSVLLLQIKAGEEVGREHGLMKQDFASPGGFLVADARTERFDAIELPQGGRGDVLRFVLGSERIPSSAVFEMVGRQFSHKAEF